MTLEAIENRHVDDWTELLAQADYVLKEIRKTAIIDQAGNVNYVSLYDHLPEPHLWFASDQEIRELQEEAERQMKRARVKGNLGSIQPFGPR